MNADKTQGGSGHAPSTQRRRADSIRIGGVVITNATRLVYPQAGISKADVANYYLTVSRWMLADVVGRPLSLLRCPEGIGGERFFQRHIGGGLGRHVRAVAITESSGRLAQYLCIDDERGLLELAQMNTLELHVWGSRADAPDRPDRVVFDLDPGEGVAWTDVVAAANEIRARLRALDLRSFVRLTGGKGLHVVAPFRIGPAWEQVKRFCANFAAALVQDRPDIYIAHAAKAQRKQRIFVDWLRNVRGATSIASWSLRAHEGAPIAMPLRWDELGSVEGPQAYDLGAALRRSADLDSDPWAGRKTLRQNLPV